MSKIYNSRFPRFTTFPSSTSMLISTSNYAIFMTKTYSKLATTCYYITYVVPSLQKKEWGFTLQMGSVTPNHLNIIRINIICFIYHTEADILWSTHLHRSPNLNIVDFSLSTKSGVLQGPRTSHLIQLLVRIIISKSAPHQDLTDWTILCEPSWLFAFPMTVHSRR